MNAAQKEQAIRLRAMQVAERQLLRKAREREACDCQDGMFPNPERRRVLLTGWIGFSGSYGAFPKGRPRPPGEGTYVEGRLLYEAQCAACHGMELQGLSGGMAISPRWRWCTPTGWSADAVR